MKNMAQEKHALFDIDAGGCENSSNGCARGVGFGGLVGHF
jgi:hypothetical protein